MLRKNINLFLLILVITTSSFISSKKQGELNNVTISKTESTSLYKNIKKGSFLAWRATHLGGVNARFGKMFYKEASVYVENDKITNASIVIDMSKLTVEGLSGDEAEDLANHLKSSDFFNIKKQPTSKFKLRSIETLTGKYNSKITGDLTIIGITKSITFKATINVLEKEVFLKSEKFTINREDWGLTYHAKGAVGVPLDYLISDDIEFAIDITFVK